MENSLRPYQNDAADCVFGEWQKVRSTLLVLATGLGKSVIIAEVIRRSRPKRVLVLAHREELIYQLCNTIRAWAGIDCEIEMADQVAKTNLFHRMPVVVSTIQTQNSGRTQKRFERFDPLTFDLIVIDEAHHGIAASYQSVIKHYFQNPNTKMLCVTATPDRFDEESLGQICNSTAYNMGILEGIKEGWLVPVDQDFKRVRGLDYSHVRTTAGDLNNKDLAEVVQREENIAGMVHPSLEAIYGLAPEILSSPGATLSDLPVEQWQQKLLPLKPHRTIIFAASVMQAENLCKIFNRVVPKIAEWVCGETAKDDRHSTLKRFASGETAVVVNVGILLEGYDNPGVEVIIMARATKSRALYSQCIGRATRPLPGVVDGLETAAERTQAIKNSPKTRCLIIDFVGNSGRHHLITSFDVLGGKCSAEVIERAKKNALKAKNPKRADAAVRNAEREILEEAREREREERARKACLVPKVDYTTKKVDPFDLSSSSSAYKKNTGSNRSKDGREFSEKQMKYLSEAGVSAGSVAYRQGQAIIAKVLSGPSPKQKEWLSKHQYDPSVFSRSEASLIMDAWAKNNWKRPDNEADLLGG